MSRERVMNPPRMNYVRRPPAVMFVSDINREEATTADGGLPSFWVEERHLAGSRTDTQRTVNTDRLHVVDRNNNGFQFPIPNPNGGVITEPRQHRNHLERNAVVEVHTPIERRTIRETTSGVSGETGDVMLAGGASVGLIRVTRWRRPLAAYERIGIFHTYTIDPRQSDLRLRHIMGRVRDTRSSNALFMVNASFFGGADARDSGTHYVGFGKSEGRNNPANEEEARYPWAVDRRDENGFVHNAIASGTEQHNHFKTLIYFHDNTYIFSHYKDLNHSDVTNIYSKTAKFIISGADEAYPLGHRELRARVAMGICSNSAGVIEEIIFMACSEKPGAFYSDVAKELRNLHFNDILMLDGGGSTSFFAEGVMRVDYGRTVASAFEV